MIAYEALCLRERPDWVVVVGDVNSTLAAALAAKKLDIRVAHLEAGLRSGDRRMPEEINRLAVDAIADLFWTPSENADENLLKEGVARAKIVRVGNVMIDAYCSLERSIDQARMPQRLDLAARRYVVATLHRPANVDQFATLAAVVQQLVEVQAETQIVFPVHPRTRARLRDHQLWEVLAEKGVRLLDPTGYVDFMSLVKGSAAVITDSGGVQEETTFLGIPCLTVRDTTERPITVTRGTNQLVSVEDLAARTRGVLSRSWGRPSIDLWDGHAAERIVDSLGRACDDDGSRASANRG